MTSNVHSSSPAAFPETIMSDAQDRLNTFLRWPDDIPVLPVSVHTLADAGFYVNRTQFEILEIQCFACGLCIDNWRDGDVPMDRHRVEMPQCPFVREIESRDVPTSDRIDNRVAEVDSGGIGARLEENGRVLDGVQIGNRDGIAENIPRELYQFEEVRLQSFIHWPVPDIVSPSALARAGFYSLNPNTTTTASDSVQCAFCEGAVGSWERGDCPDREHRRHFPLCPFVVDTINPRLNRLELDRGADSGANVGLMLDRAGRSLNVHVVNGGGMGNLQELGVHTHTAPRKPRFTSLSARLASFAGWPPHLIQTPAVLAEAGFYYEHPNQLATAQNAVSSAASDHVRCFHCDGGLKHWDPHDDPWTEHARWFPQCSYVLLVKGPEFVAQASRGAAEGQDGDNRQSTTTTTSSPASTPIPTLPSSTSTPILSHPPHTPVTDRELQIHLQAPPALEALNLGIVVERVKQAIKEKLERTGSGFSNGAALIEAALNLQRDEDLETREASGTNTEETGVSNAFFQMLKDALHESIPVQNDPQDSEPEPRDETIDHLPTPTTITKDTRRGSTNMTVLNAKSHSSIQTDLTKPTDKDKSASTVKLSLEEENRLLREARLCKICMDSEVGIVFLPCGHLATCVQCAPNLQACPVCRSSIRATVRTFLS